MSGHTRSAKRATAQRKRVSQTRQQRTAAAISARGFVTPPRTVSVRTARRTKSVATAQRIKFNRIKNTLSPAQRKAFKAQQRTQLEAVRKGAFARESTRFSNILEARRRSARRTSIQQARTAVLRAPRVTPSGAERAGFQGFQGDVGVVGEPRGILPPTSKFEIIGGKAVPKGAVPSSLIGAVAAGNLGISKTPTISKRTGQPLPQNIIEVFRGQQAVTFQVAENFRNKRNLALSSGSTIDEAQRFAEVTTIGLPKSKQEAINTALQKAIIERKAGQLKLAKELIQEQTTTGEAGQLDDLAAQLEKAEPIPATQIEVAFDSAGNDISPRKTRLQIENALLTGNTLDDLDFNVTQDNTIVSSSEAGTSVLSLVDGALTFDFEQFQKTLNPEAVKQASGSEESVFDSILKDISESRVSPQLVAQAEVGEIQFTPEDISRITTEGREAVNAEVVEGFFNAISQDPTGIQIEELEGGFITLTSSTGDVIFQGTREEFDELLTQLSQTFQLQLDEAPLSGEQTDFINSLLAEIEILQEQLRGGQSISESLSGFFNIFFELQRQLAEQQGLISELQAGQPEAEQDPFANFFNLVGQLFNNFVLFISGGTR